MSFHRATAGGFPGSNGKIVFLRDAAADGGEIYVMGSDGSSPTNLTNSPNEEDSNPSFNATGTKIAWESEGDVWTMDASGANKTNLTDGDFDQGARQPTWSPNGAQIAFEAEHATDPDGHVNIWVMNADGSSRVNRSASTTTNDSKPTWKPDGTRIAFAGVDAGISVIRGAACAFYVVASLPGHGEG